MAPTLAKLKEKARRLTAKGKHAKALGVYLELAAAEPDRARWHHKVGEAHRRLGRDRAAVSAYIEAASRYAHRGFLLKAIAMGQMALSIDATHSETQAMLARLYADRAEETGGVRVPGRAAASSDEAIDSAASPLDLAPPPSGPPGIDVVARPGGYTVPPGAALDAVRLGEALPNTRTRASSDSGTPTIVEVELGAPSIEGALGVFAADASSPQIELPRTPLFSSLDEASLRSLIERVVVLEHGPGEQLIREGSEGRCLYVLVEGRVAVFHEGQPRIALGTLEEGAFFGEIALLTSFRRQATVETQTDCVLIEISRDVIASMVEEHPAVLRVMLRFFRERLINTLVATSPLFSPFGVGEDAFALAARFNFVEIEPGVDLVREGGGAEALYVVASGTVEVTRQLSDGPLPIATLGPGDIVGVDALLMSDPAVATSRTVTRCWLLELPAATFRDVIMTHPQVLATVSELVDERRRAVARMIADQGQFPREVLPLI